VEEAREARDELLDRVEAELVEEGSLRYFLDFEYHHPGSPEAIVYAWASPLLRQAVLLRLGAKAANLAGRFLAFLRQRQPQRTREIARIEVELASYLDDPEERERSLRELGWWIEIDQAEELQALLEQDLRSGRLDPERLFDAAQAADRSRATRRWAMLEALAQVPGTLPAPRLFGYHLLRGEVLWDLARFRDAQAEAKLALRIGEAQSGRVSQERAGALALQGLSYLRLGQFGAAEGSLREALAVALELLGPDHPGVAINLRNLASLLEDTRRLSEAEPLLRQALAIDEAAFGPDHPTVAIDLNGLAWVLNQTGRLGEAETLARRALAIDEAASGPDHPAVATRLSILGTILYDANRLAEAEPLLRRALAISEAFLGPEHPRVASHLSVLGALLRATNRLGEAESLVRRALAIDEATLGQEHPEVALQLNNLAALLCDSDRMGEAEPLARRALDIDEGSFGANHPAVARDLGNLAWLLEHTARVAEAEPLMRRALQILLVFRRQNGHPHPDFQAACARYRALLAAQGRTEAEIEAVIAELEQTTGDADLEEPSPEKAPA
jgi:Tfp pilus assembly protein PilF